MSLQVRLIKGNKEAQYYGKWIYPGNEWLEIDERYRKFAENDKGVEVKKEQKNEQQLVQTAQSINNVEENQVKQEQNEKEKQEQKSEQIYIDPLVTEIITGVWTQGRKKINEINNVSFLKDKLLPELEKLNKTALIDATQKRIEVLTT